MEGDKLVNSVTLFHPYEVDRTAIIPILSKKIKERT